MRSKFNHNIEHPLTQSNHALCYIHQLKAKRLRLISNDYRERIAGLSEGVKILLLKFLRLRLEILDKALYK